MEHYKNLLKTVYKTPTTQKEYLARLSSLHKIQPDLDRFLKNPTTEYPALQAAYPSILTRKNLLTLILVLFREDAALKTLEATRTQWKKLHDDLARHMDAKVKRSEPSNKQVEKYTSYEEIEAKYEELKKHSPHTTERSSYQFLLLSVIVHLKPKRADFGAVRLYRDVVPSGAGKEHAPTDHNYMVLRSRGSSFLAMNMYKTSKHYQTVEEDLPEGLKRDVEESLRRWPRTYLFQKGNGEAMSNNTYSAFVKSTFQQLFGRGTGVSLLRHIYLTEKMDFDDTTLEEQEDVARLMLHTSGLQRKYKWPKKTICPKLCAEFIKPIKPVKRTLKRRRPEKRED
jgi:hypothetical protein